MYIMYVNNTDIQGVTLGLNFRLNDEQFEKSKPFNPYTKQRGLVGI